MKKECKKSEDERMKEKSELNTWDQQKRNDTGDDLVKDLLQNARSVITLRIEKEARTCIVVQVYFLRAP